MLSIFPVPVRAYVFVLIAFSCAIFFLFTLVTHRKYLIQWFAYWVIITSVAFLSHNMWMLILTVAGICFFALPRQESKRLVCYFVLLPVIPDFTYVVPSFVPSINFLFDLTYPWMLALFILFPLFLKLLLNPNFIKRDLFENSVDKFVLLFAILSCILGFRNPTITSGMRAGFYIVMFTSIVPYYVISRYIKTYDDFQRVIIAILFSAIMISFVGIFEEYFKWWFYEYLPNSLGFVPLSSELYDFRGGLLRVRATMDPIPLGYFISLAFGALFFLRTTWLKSRLSILIIMTLFSVILFFTDSRGAWLATAVLLAVFLYLKTLNKKLKALIITITIFIIVGANIMADKLHTFQVDKYGTFDYRLELIQKSVTVIKNHFFFGTQKPNEHGALESLRQGQGIIDIVNTYLEVAFNSGMIGLLLFMSIFFGLLVSIYIEIKKIDKKRGRKYWLLGNLLIAMLIATMVMIATVSSVSYIPTYYLALIALGSAYIRMMKSLRIEPTLWKEKIPTMVLAGD